MNLTDLLSLNTMFSAALFQKAYDDLVTRIRLSLHCFPVKIDGSTSFDHFNTLHTLITSGSIICFKEIRSLTGCVLTTTIPDEYSSSPVVVGDYMLEDYGFSDYDDLLTNPDVSIHNSDVVVVSDTEKKSVLLLHGYAYPYPVLHGNPYVEYHSYLVAAMITAVGQNNLAVDDVIAVLSIPKMIALYHLENGDTERSREYESIYDNLLNLYNENEEVLTKDRLSIGVGGDAF